MTKTILLTGFEPFAGNTLNSSWEAVRALAGQRIGHEHVVVSELLPCAFDDSLQQLNQLIELHQPEIVVAVGQARQYGAAASRPADPGRWACGLLLDPAHQGNRRQIA